MTDFSPQSKAAGFGVFGISSLRLASSIDGEKTFTRAVNITDKNNPGASQIFGSFTVTPNGTIHVGWIFQASEASPVGSEVRISKSTNGGSIFGPSTKVDSPANQCDNIILVSDSNNSPYITWRKIFDTANEADPDSLVTVRDIVLSKSANGGHSFISPRKVHNDNFVTGQCITTGAPMAFDSKDKLHIAWYTGKELSSDIYYAVSTDKEKTFTKPIAIINGTSVPPLKSSLSVDKFDNTWIAWENMTGTNKQEFLHVPSSSQLHNRSVNSTLEGSQNQSQTHQLSIATNSISDSSNEKIASKIQLSTIAPGGKLAQSHSILIQNGNGNMQSLSITSEGDLISLVWTNNNSIYFLPFSV
jgi:hypothetical protein